jgi:chromosome segregation ATPase
VVINVYPVGSRLARLEVILRKSANGNYAEGDAGKLAGALVERLKVAYAESASAARKAAVARRDPLEKELKSVQQRADELRARQQEIHSALSINGNMYAYSGNASYQLNNIRSQRKSLQTELVRNQARLQTLEPASGPLVAQWADIVKVRQKHLDELKKASDDKKPSDEELREAENKLTDAVAQLAAAKQVQPTDGMNVQFRANEIANLHSSIADEEDRIKQMDAQIAKLQDPKFQQQLERLPEMQNEESRLRSQSMELQNQLDQVRRASQEEGAVIVTVLDGQAH